MLGALEAFARVLLDIDRPDEVAFVVDDAEALRARMRAAGFRDSTVPNAHPWRKRVYFIDPDGNDWEFVQYLSEDPARRNDYLLSG